VHPFDGARVANILPAIADELGLEDQEGVVILSVQPNSKAARIGFQARDVIQQVGRAKVETVNELEGLLKERQQVWQIVVKRGNQTMRLQLGG
jgi:serine protease Do